MLTACVTFSAGALFGAALAYVLVRSSRATAFDARALRAEMALDLARQNLETARADQRALFSEVTAARAEAAAREASLIEVRLQLDRDREAAKASAERLRETFGALAGEALHGASAQFLTLAETQLRGLIEKADGSLDQREKAVADLVGPVRESLDKLGLEQRRLAETRSQEAAVFTVELAGLRQQSALLGAETARLVNALRAPQVRGRWGEVQLKRTAELAGMSEHCDFVEQETIDGEDGRQRPDMIVNLPNGRQIVVDSKVPFTHFLGAIEATTEEAREEALRRHAQLVREHVGQLSEKRYWASCESAEFVVMFLPNDAFLAAAAERDPSLVEQASAARVVLATPSTFIALLRAVALGFREERLAENAEHIAELGRELYDRLAKLSDHVSDIGDGLGKAVRAYNRSVGSLESRVLVQARRFRELGAATDREIEAPEPVGELPRELN